MKWELCAMHLKIISTANKKRVKFWNIILIYSRLLGDIWLTKIAEDHANFSRAWVVALAWTAKDSHEILATYFYLKIVIKLSITVLWKVLITRKFWLTINSLKS